MKEDEKLEKTVVIGTNMLLCQQSREEWQVPAPSGGIPNRLLTLSFLDLLRLKVSNFTEIGQR